MATQTLDANVRADIEDASSAARTAWSIIPGSVQLKWTARKKYFMVIPKTVNGSFGQISGTITMKDSNPETAMVDIQVPVASQGSGQAKRDAHLLKPEFFDAVNHPLVTFESTGIQRNRSSANGYEVSGLLTARGITRPLTLTGRFEPAPHRSRAHVVLEGSINRQEFGMTWNAVPIMTLFDDIALRIEVDIERS